ncbi:RimL Acetyltransferases, including N-acetylases of ribosomal proteins [Paracoccaceae bacterium]
MIAPTLHTDRLTLRMPRLADFDHHAAFHASRRAEWEGGAKSRKATWYIWAGDVAVWALRGYGAFSVELDGTFVGEVGIYQPDHFPGPEFGWMVTAEAEGKGFAFEAAQVALAWVGATFDWPHITSIIDPDNARSIALGLRLGGVIDPSLPGVDEGDVVIRHDLRGTA